MSERRRLTNVLLSALGLILGFLVGRGRIVEVAPQPAGFAGLPGSGEDAGRRARKTCTWGGRVPPASSPAFRRPRKTRPPRGMSSSSMPMRPTRRKRR